MTSEPPGPTEKSPSRRLSKAERRVQLLETARIIIREEGADRLTLGHLALRAGVSKPIAYDHFGTRAGLLIELYKAMDVAQSNALREALTVGDHNVEDVVAGLASAYIHCAADTSGEWYAVGAALAGSEEMDAVYQGLIDGYVQLFASVLQPFTDLSPVDLARRCIGLIGAGEALSAAMVRGDHSEAEAAETFAALIKGSLTPSSRTAHARADEVDPTDPA
jgi:AcrR family transcriptional regulator